MTDRELLELTAKAAGYKVHHTVEGKDCLAIIDPSGYWGNEHKYWNPLTDDGDALRLAVKLRLAVYTAIDNGRPPMYAAAWAGGYPNNIRCEGEHGTDPYAATRRAIVRAAAEIGRGME